jgi:hypothetical protein
MKCKFIHQYFYIKIEIINPKLTITSVIFQIVLPNATFIKG